MSIEDVWLNVVRILELDRHLGERVLGDATWLIRPAPQEAPEAWDHAVFPPLGADEVENLRREMMPIHLPQALRSLYLYCNGCHLFGGAIEIWGKRRNWIRTGDAAWQPFSLADHNREMRPPQIRGDLLVFGFDSEAEASLVFGDTSDDPAVTLVELASGEVLGAWESLGVMLDQRCMELHVARSGESSGSDAKPG